MPNGSATWINKHGVAYYHALIDAVLAEGITPMVTLFHWDLPSSLQALGGWESEDMIGYFTEFAKFCFNEYGDKVLGYNEQV